MIYTLKSPNDLMAYLLIFIVIYLSIVTAIRVSNAKSFKTLKAQLDEVDLNLASGSMSEPLISICIPARNEANNIEKLLNSCFAQTYQNLQILVLDDESTDGTTEILANLSKKHSSLTVIKGNPKPNNWLGKPWACHQLSSYARGDFLVFLDADTWLEKSAISDLVTLTNERKLDAMTVWPEQVTHSFWEKIVIPQVYYVLFTVLPVRFTQEVPWWVPNLFQSGFRKVFSAGCGQCFVFSRASYESIGGHASVRNKVVEDVELARLLRSKGLTLGMLHGYGSVCCRMYTNHHEILQGFRKNFFSGFGYSYILFVLAALLHITVYLLPAGLLLYAAFSSDLMLFTVSLLIILWIALLRWTVDRVNGWSSVPYVEHALGVCWFQWLGLIVLLDAILGRNVQWKSRELHVSDQK